MKQTAFWIVSAAVVAGLLIWWVAPSYLDKSIDRSSMEHLSNVAAEINRSVPVMIDAETELLPSQAGEAMLVYNYRLIKYSVGQIDHQKFAAGAKQRVTQGACNQPVMRDDFLKQGVTLRYSYFDKNKQHIATVEVTRADCGF
ncbi:MAG TPA: hypothetical protein VEG60_13850 [Candidatus Binatia bacterium]|nr:hypothetical protein [Candidatus Binatia bacterium]